MAAAKSSVCCCGVVVRLAGNRGRRTTGILQVMSHYFCQTCDSSF